MSRFYVTTAIPYANGAPHIGHAYERIATDAIQRFMRLDGCDTLFVTGMDEYGLKVQQTAAREGMTPQAFVDRIAAEFEAMGELLNARADDIVRTTQPRHARSVQEIWRRMAANGDIYLSTYSGWYSVRDEAYFDESELSPGPDATKLAPTGAPVEWVEEESWFFRLSAYADRLLAHYAAHPEFVTPERSATTRRLHQARALRPFDQPHDVWLGRAGPRRSEACHVCLGGRPDELPHRDWLSRRRPAVEVLAGRRACDRQGHHPLPRHLLARLPDVGRAPRSPTDRRAWLSVQSRREDVEVGRQRGEPSRPRRSLRSRSGALLLSAGSPVRAGRQLFARGDRQPHECRSRQRHRESGAALAQHDREELRFRHPRPAGRHARARGSGAPRPRRRSGRRGPPPYGELPHPPLCRGRVRRRRRDEPLLRQCRALEARQERPRAHAARPLCDDRSAARLSDPPAAGHTRQHGQAARSARRPRGPPLLRCARSGDARGRLGAPHRLEPGGALPAPSPIFPRYVEPEAAK